jgi:hypothetical protein
MCIYKICINTAVFFIGKSIELGAKRIKGNCYIPVAPFFCSLKKKMLYQMGNAIVSRILIPGTSRYPEAKRNGPEMWDGFADDF